MSVPPWYRPRRRPLAESVLTLDLSRTTGIGPLEAGLSTMWDMTPILCASDPSHRVRVTVDANGAWLNVTKRGKFVAVTRLEKDTKRIGAPLRAICSHCDRKCYRLYLWGQWLKCGKCLRVTYASGQRSENDRATNRQQRLEYRWNCTENLPRHRGRRKIQAEIIRQDRRIIASLPLSLLRVFAGVSK